MTFSLKRLTCAVAAISYSHLSVADHDHQVIETVNVIGQAIPTAITRTDMDQFSPGLETGDSLRDLLGVSGSRMGGHGIDPTIRGLSQTQLNVLLDGAYVHGGCPNRMDPPTSYASAIGFEEVTVIRGSQTLAYGGGGPGGTVLFSRVTEPFADDGEVRGKLSAAWRGNSNTRDLTADIALGNQQMYVRALIGQSDSGNYQDGNGEIVRAAYREYAGTLLLGYTPSTDTRVELSLDRQDTLDALYPGTGMDSPEAINTTVRVKAETRWGTLDKLRLELYSSNVDHVMDSYSLRATSPMRMRAPSTSDTIGGRAVVEFNTDWGAWTVGIDGQYNDRSAQRYNDAVDPPALNSLLWPDVSIDQTGVFAELERPLNPSWSVKGGLRYDHVTSSASETDVKPAGMVLSPTSLYELYYGDTDTDRTDRNIGGLLRLEYTPNNGQQRWYAGVSRSVRTPDATERYIASNGMMPSARWVGDPGLAPEIHHQFELGLSQQWQRVNLETAVYLNRVNDYVLRDRWVEPMNNASIYRNIDATLMGAELRLQVALTEGLNAEFGLSRVRGTNRTDDRDLAQIPPLEGLASLNWHKGAWSAGAQLQWAATQTRVDTLSSSGIPGQGLDARETPGWGIVNLNLSYQISSSVLLESGIDNALDKAYAQHLNRGNAFDPTQIQVAEPGRAAWLRVTATF